jgi:DNA-binding NtrC family response regulator
MRHVDVRVVSATHRRREEGLAGGAFRADLFYRLNAVQVRLPALRERGEDVLLLAHRFLARAAASLGAPAPEIAPELAERLRQHPWPGNVRELLNACAYAVRVAGARGVVSPRHWPAFSAPAADTRFGLHAETRALEERRLREALERARGNKSRAARVLGLSRQGLLKKLRRYGLEPTAPSDDEIDAAASPA